MAEGPHPTHPHPHRVLQPAVAQPEDKRTPHANVKPPEAARRALPSFRVIFLPSSVAEARMGAAWTPSSSLSVPQIAGDHREAKEELHTRLQSRRYPLEARPPYFPFVSWISLPFLVSETRMAAVASLSNSLSPSLSASQRSGRSQASYTCKCKAVGIRWKHARHVLPCFVRPSCLPVLQTRKWPQQGLSPNPPSLTRWSSRYSCTSRVSYTCDC
jgi:hypothetical protein